MDETATRELDTQAPEQILIGHMMVFNGEKLDMEAVWKVRDGFFPPNERRL